MDAPKKNTFWDKFKKVQQSLKQISLFPQKEQEEFQKYLSTVSKMDGSYENIKEAVKLCEESLEIVKTRIEVMKQLQQLQSQERVLENYEKLNKEDVKKIQELQEAHKTAEREKAVLKHQMKGYDKSLDYLRQYEEEIEKVLKEMDEAEENQRAVKQDMNYLEGEKGELSYSKEKIEEALGFIYKFSIVAVCVFAGIVFLLAILYIGYEIRILVPGAVTTVVAIFLGSVIYIFRRRLVYEMQKNTRLQARAVELLNKAKLKYVHYTNFLQYEYKKFRVHSADMLRGLWEEYTIQKRNALRYRKMSTRIIQIEEDIEKYVKDKEIEDVSFVYTQEMHLSILEQKKKENKDMLMHKRKIEKRLDVLDYHQEEIWKQLLSLKERDESEEHMIEKIIQSYLEDVQKLMEPLDKS